MAPSSPSLISLERPREKPTLLDEQDDVVWVEQTPRRSLLFGVPSPGLAHRPPSPSKDDFSDSEVASPVRPTHQQALVISSPLPLLDSAKAQSINRESGAREVKAPPTPSSFLIHLSGGGTHVWRAPTTPEAKARPRAPQRLERHVKPRIINGPGAKRSPLRSLGQIPRPIHKPPFTGQLKASAATFAPRTLSAPPVSSPGRLRYSLPNCPIKGARTPPKPYQRSPPLSPPTSPLSRSSVSSSAPAPDDFADLLTTTESDLGVINSSAAQIRDFFAHKYESFPFPVVDLPRARAPKVYFGKGEKSQRTSAEQSSASTPAAQITPEKRKRSADEVQKPSKKLNRVVRTDSYASKDEASTDEEYESNSERGESLSGLEICRTEDLLGLGSPEILGPIYARSWDSYTFSDEAELSDTESVIDPAYQTETMEMAYQTGSVEMEIGVGAKSAKDRIGREEEVRTAIGLAYLIPVSPSSSESPRQDLANTAGTSPVSSTSTNGSSSKLPEVVGAFDRLMSTPSPRAIMAQNRSYETGSSLERSVMRRWIASDVGVLKLRAIKKFCDRLSDLLNKTFAPASLRSGGPPRFVVDVFGSMAWGGQTGSSGDLDLVVRYWRTSASDGIKVATTRHVTTNLKLAPIYDLRNVVKTLRAQGFRDVLGIYAASTPIVKFRADIRGGGTMECDLNINDLGGWYNSRLILAYCEISPYVLRPMIHALKLWASAQEVNDPSGQKSPPSMSSYCLTLMAIAYLQVRGVLPNLQAGVTATVPEAPADEGDDIVWVGMGKEQGVKCHVGFATVPPDGWTPRNSDMSVDEALRGFFAFFARDAAKSGSGFDWEASVVSVLHGGRIPRARPRATQGNEVSKEESIVREMNMGKGDLGIQPRNWAERRLVVQDPFIWQKNCAQAMSRAGLDRWWDAVDYANKKFADLGQSATLEDILVSFSPLAVRAPRIIGGPQVGFGRGGGRGRGVPSPRGSPRGRGLWRG